jgi:acetate kinase
VAESFGSGENMNILALNAGSATLKYKLFAMPAEDVLAEGSLDHPGGDGIVQAAQKAVDQCRSKGIGAVGHRMVHGGSHFARPARVTPEMLAVLRTLRELDPLHNPTEVAMIEAGLRALPSVPAVAVFDTAFHQTMPEVAWRYALPREPADAQGLRRYGFHGISYRYVSERLLECLGRRAVGTRLIVCHLGSGASVCALRDGASVDTSMGLTPLEGLVMGTRSGDIDPGLLLYLLRSRNMTPEALDDLLNHRSGLKGLSGGTGDVRDLETASSTGDDRAALALEIFAYRVRKYIGAYAAALGGIDAIALTGGIGEHSPEMRARITRSLEFLGVRMDAALNQAASGRAASRLTVDDSPTQVWVVPTDEERQIAREVGAVLSDA